MNCFDAFLTDLQAWGIILIEEISGSDKKGPATALKEAHSGLSAKPVVSVIASLTAPPSKIMSHAGTIIAFGTGQAKGKITALPSARAAIRMNLIHLDSILHCTIS